MNDAELLAQFETCLLPFDQWTHRMHVRLAYIYLASTDFDSALERLRIGIKTYNEANNVEDGPTTGYHETITHALLHIIAATMEAHGNAFPTGNSEEFCELHPQLMQKRILRLFYSPERILSPQAKHTFVEPDLTALPRRSQRVMQMNDSDQNRRRHPRIACPGQEIPAAVEFANGSVRTFQATSRNISCGGLAMVHNQAIPVGSLCKVILPMRTADVLAAPGRVVACRSLAMMLHELAVEFDEPLSEVDFAELRCGQ